MAEGLVETSVGADGSDDLRDFLVQYQSELKLKNAAQLNALYDKLSDEIGYDDLIGLSEQDLRASLSDCGIKNIQIGRIIVILKKIPQSAVFQVQNAIKVVAISSAEDDALMNIKTIGTKVDEIINNITINIAKLDENSQKCEDKINDTFDDIVNIVNKRRIELLLILKHMTQNKENKLNELLQNKMIHNFKLETSVSMDFEININAIHNVLSTVGTVRSKHELMSVHPVINVESKKSESERNAELERELFGDAYTIQQGTNFKNYDDILVETSGREVPVAIDDFGQSNLCEILMNNISLCQYTTPTPIQKYSIPCVMQHRDLMACAQAGSGKTVAFLLPIIHNLFVGHHSGGYNKLIGGNNNHEVYPSAVIFSSTRELAIQIHVQARKFLYRTGLRACVVYGGADWRKQLRDLRNGVDIIVATPGRLMDFVERGFVKMSAVQYNVLDNADIMLDLGFMPQIKQIISEMPPKDSQRQTLMFSVTCPLEIQKLAQDFLNDYIFITVGRIGSINTFIDQKLLFVEEYDKTNKLIETVKQMTKTENNGIPLTLVFVERKKDAARVEKELIRSGYDTMSIHSDRTQREREHALRMFRMGKISLLVATDVASCGLDIPNVMCVINYDLPNHIDSYVHRIGRTGRCGNNGNAISFVNEGNKPVIKSLMSLLKESKSEIPQWFEDLYHKYSSYNYSGSGFQNKYGKWNNRNGGGGYGKRFGARDYRRGRGGSGSGYKRNTYSHNNDNGAVKYNNNNNYGNSNPNPNMNMNSRSNKKITESW